MTEQDLRTPVVLAVTPIVSGVVTWALRLREALRNDERYAVRLVTTDRAGYESIGADGVVSTMAGVQRLLKRWRRGIFVPNYLWDFYYPAAGRIARGADWRVLGYCHADSAKEYYRYLALCEPVVSRFVAVSPRCAQELARFVPARREEIETLPYFVDLLPKPPAREDPPPIRIAYAGRLVQEQKRIFDLTAVLARLEERQVPFRFLLAGEGGEERVLRNLLARFEANGSVEFVGRLTPAETLSIWRSVHVFFQCSEFEGTSVSMLEAMGQACVPVVSRTQSGVAGVVEHGRNGFLFEIGDTRRAADLIEGLASRPLEWRQASEGALRSAAAYAAEAHVRRLKGIWDEALRSPPRTRPARTWFRRRRIASVRRGLNVFLFFQRQVLKRLRPSALQAFVVRDEP